MSYATNLDEEQQPTPSYLQIIKEGPRSLRVLHGESLWQYSIMQPQTGGRQQMSHADYAKLEAQQEELKSLTLSK